VRSRKILALGAAVVVIAALVVVLVGRGGEAPLTIEHGEGAFALRGSLAKDTSAIDAALQAWRDGKGAAGHSKAARVRDGEVHLLYAGTVGDRDVVILTQDTRLIALHQPYDRGWVVGEAQETFDPFEADPVLIDDAVLLPGGDWRYLKLRGRDTPPKIVDGLVSEGSAYGGSFDAGFLLQASAPRPTATAKLFDPDAGTVTVDAKAYAAVTDAERTPGRLIAIHAALVANPDPEGTGRRHASPVETVWTGTLPGLGQAAVVARKEPDRVGLGIVREPDGFVSAAESLSLGEGTNPTGGHVPGIVGAVYAGHDDERQTLVATGTAGVARLEILVGTRRFTRPGPVALVPVDWNPLETDAVVVGRTAGGAVVAPLIPRRR
jgi:hypothetical protein